MAKRPKVREEPIYHRLRILSWGAGYYGRSSSERGESFDLEVCVEPVGSMRGITRGYLRLSSTTSEKLGGSLHYDSARIVRGWAIMGEIGLRTLLSVLLAGRYVELHLCGEPFRYCKAWITEVTWFTDRHPEVEEVEV